MFKRRLTVIVTVTAIVLAGQYRLFAAPPATGSVRTLSGVSNQPEELMKELEALMQRVKGPGDWSNAQRRRIKMGLAYLDIANAKTPADRHSRIRRLPVTIHETPVDAQGGTTRTFIAGGKARISVSVSPRQSVSVDSIGLPDAPDGATPSHATSANPLCDDDELGPGDCPSQQELDDALILVASLEAEEESMTIEMGDLQAQHEAYCSMYGCSESESAEPCSGPSAETASRESCAGRLWSAAWTVGEAAVERRSLWSKVQGFMSGTGKLSTARLAMSAATVSLSGAAAVLTVSLAAYCVYHYYNQEPVWARLPETIQIAS